MSGKPIRPGDRVTLHYRLACQGEEIVDTFADDMPETFVLGMGEIDPRLEALLLEADLLLELDAPVAHPAPLIARLAARASRAMDGRKVDVLLLAPNLMRQPIHDIAQRQGILL